MNAERLLAHYERIADGPDAIGRLRRFIVDLAVRGKLVPQDANDELVTELLKRIAKAKAERKKETGDARIKIEPDPKPDELAMGLPRGWAVQSFENLFLFIDYRGNTPPKTDDGIPLITAKNIRMGYLNREPREYISKATFNTWMTRGFPEIGDLFFTTEAPLANICLNDIEEPFALAQRAICFQPYTNIDTRFLMFALMSDVMQSLINKHATGMTAKGIKAANLKPLPIPIPPLAEQHRIVAKVDELMALCDRLEAARAEREMTRDRLTAASLAGLNTPDTVTFRDDASFVIGALPALTARPDQIKQLRQTILNLAVRGKLVAQDPNDEPASELLKQIAAERADLVKSRLIRREEPLDTIKTAETPFSIPNKWLWSRIGDAFLFTQYGTSQKSHHSENGVPVLTMGNIQGGLVVWNNEKKIPETCEDLPALFLRKFDILYNRTNSAELVGKTGIYLGEDGIRTFASYLIRLRPSLKWTEPRYLNLAMNASVFRETQIVPLIKKQTGQANVNGTALKNMLIPLPPLAEQHRIVAKVDELMALCNRLEGSLATAGGTRSSLLDALLAEALTPVEARARLAAE